MQANKKNKLYYIVTLERSRLQYWQKILKSMVHTVLLHKNITTLYSSN